MATKPIKFLELHYTMTQFLIISDIPQFYLGNIRPRDAFRPIARERKYLMDYKHGYLKAGIICSSKRTDNAKGQISELNFAPN